MSGRALFYLKMDNLHKYKMMKYNSAKVLHNALIGGKFHVCISNVSHETAVCVAHQLLAVISSHYAYESHPCMHIIWPYMAECCSTRQVEMMPSYPLMPFLEISSFF